MNRRDMLRWLTWNPPFPRMGNMDIEFVGGPKDGDWLSLRSNWSTGCVVAFRVEPHDKVLHYYQVQEKASGVMYFMYVGPHKP